MRNPCFVGFSPRYEDKDSAIAQIAGGIEKGQNPYAATHLIPTLSSMCLVSAARPGPWALHICTRAITAHPRALHCCIKKPSPCSRLRARLERMGRASPSLRASTEVAGLISPKHPPTQGEHSRQRKVLDAKELITGGGVPRETGSLRAGLAAPGPSQLPLLRYFPLGRPAHMCRGAETQGLPQGPAILPLPSSASHFWSPISLHGRPWSSGNFQC